MDNKDLAQKIVDAKVVVHKDEHTVTDDDGNTSTVVSYRAVLDDTLGMTLAFDGDTKKDVLKKMATRITAMLENSEIIVSDTWAEDNL